MLEFIKLKNYRNIEQLETSLERGANIIIAKNGSGKTNILESIYYSVFGTSFRPLKSNVEVISLGKEYSKIDLKWDSESLAIIISNINNSINRNFQLNQKKYPVTKISQRFPIILFAPHSVDLITGEPSIRRLDLDNFLCTIFKEYSLRISRYRVILKNRNAVIKQIRDGKTNRNSLDFWTEEIVNLSFLIFETRLLYFNDINKYINESVKHIYLDDPENFKITIKYLPNIDTTLAVFKNELQNKFKDNYAKELIIGKTLYGVHKDDYILNLNNNNLRFIGSRGQQRIGTLVIKIAQLQYFFDKFSRYPLLLLDDLMSELDPGNRDKIADYLIDTDIQFLITSADKNEIPIKLINHSKVIILNIK